MVRATFSLFVVANLVFCPYLCGGILSFGCVDPSCGGCTASHAAPPGDSRSTDPCDWLGSSCVCTGAPANDPFVKILDPVDCDATDLFVCESTATSTDAGVTAAHGHNLSPPPIAGPALRARLQSWLF